MKNIILKVEFLTNTPITFMCNLGKSITLKEVLGNIILIEWLNYENKDNRIFMGPHGM